jgi:hypothetical protein
LPAFLITLAAGVPSVVLIPSVIKTVSAMNTYDSIFKPQLAHHNHRRCTEIRVYKNFTSSLLRKSQISSNVTVFFSRHAREETSDNCKMTWWWQLHQNGFNYLFDTIYIRVQLMQHTFIRFAKRMNVCCRITTLEESNFNQWF